MAYMNQERKAERAPVIKAIFKKYGIKGSIGVRHHSTLVVNIREGNLDLIGAADRYNKMVSERQGRTYYPVTEHLQANEYHSADHMREVGEEDMANFYDELVAAMLGKDYFDESDAMTDYFHCSHYIRINVGNWDKPYKFNQAA